MKNHKDVCLKDIEIGYSDAATEFKINPNTFYFDELEYLKSIINSNVKFIIIGKKGSGKTSLLYKYKDNCNKHSIINEMIYGSDIQVSFNLQSIDKISINTVYRIYLLNKISQLIIRKIHLINKITIFIKSRLTINPFKIIKQLKNCIGDDCSFNESFKICSIKTERDIYSKSNASIPTAQELKCMGGVSSTFSINDHMTYNYAKKDENEQIQCLEKNLTSLCRYIDFSLMFDDLEDALLFKKDGEIQINNIIEFLLATKNINEKICNNKSKIVISLREDIFNIMNKKSNNLNKIKEDNSIIINWSKNCDNNTLPLILRLVISKIKHNNLKYYEDMKLEDVFYSLFEKKSENAKEGKIISNIIKLTYDRPRDVIELLKKIKETYPDISMISNEHISKARANYSDYFYNELRNELLFKIPDDELDKVFDVFKKINKIIFTINDLENNINFENYTKFNDINEFIRFVFDSSIIAILENPTKKNYIAYKWKYKNPELEAYNATNFALHPGLSKHLIGK